MSVMIARVSEFLVGYLDSIDERLLDYLDEETNAARRSRLG